MSDPFASATAGTTATDPFGQKPSEIKTSEYPKLEELDKLLLVIQPTKLETGLPNPFDKDKPRDRVTADVTVIDLDNPADSKTHKDMYVSQGALIGQLKGLIETRGMILGRLRRFPALQTPKHLHGATPDEIDAALKKDPRMSFAWKLADWTEQDKEKALVWFRSKSA